MGQPQSGNARRRRRQRVPLSLDLAASAAPHAAQSVSQAQRDGKEPSNHHQDESGGPHTLTRVDTVLVTASDTEPYVNDYRDDDVRSDRTDLFFCHRLTEEREQLEINRGYYLACLRRKLRIPESSSSPGVRHCRRPSQHSAEPHLVFCSVALRLFLGRARSLLRSFTPRTLQSGR